MKSICFGLLVAALAATPQTARAQFGRLIREGAEELGKRAIRKSASEAAQEGAEAVVKRGVTSALREAGEESAETLAKRAGIVASRYSDDAAKAVARHGGATAAPIVNAFGDDGAKALAKLSPDQARRMAMLTDELSSGGRGADWMRILAERGDVAADWVWRNKGSLAVAATATAFLANPEAFLATGESIAGRTITSAGEHVARPFIEGAAKEVAPAAIREVGSVVSQHFWGLAFCGGIVAVASYFGIRSYLPSWLKPTEKSQT